MTQFTYLYQSNIYIIIRTYKYIAISVSWIFDNCRVKRPLSASEYDARICLQHIATIRTQMFYNALWK